MASSACTTPTKYFGWMRNSPQHGACGQSRMGSSRLKWNSEKHIARIKSRILRRMPEKCSVRRQHGARFETGETHRLCRTIFERNFGELCILYYAVALNPLTCYAAVLLIRLDYPYVMEDCAHWDAQVRARMRYRAACPDFSISLRDCSVFSSVSLILDMQFARSIGIELLVCLLLLLLVARRKDCVYWETSKDIFLTRELLL